MKFKRVLSVLLAVLFFMMQLPIIPVRAADEIIYEREYLERPLFNAATKAEPGYFIEDSGNSVFNVIDRFTKVHGGANIPAALSFDTAVSGFCYNGWYSFNFNTVEGKLARKGDIAVAYSANLTNNSHIDILHHLFETKLSYPYLVLSSAAYTFQSFGKALHTYLLDSDSTATVMMTDNYEFKPVGSGYEAGGLNLRVLGAGCPDGSSSVSGMAVMLADTQGPAVTGIYTTRSADPGSDLFTQFHAGETIYIHLRFDEPIRFAEDAVTEAVKNMKLNVSIKRITDNVGLNEIYAKADLVSLKNDTLTFRYTVPANFIIDGEQKPTNYYLDSVDYNAQDTWIAASGQGSSPKPSYSLKLLYKKPGDTAPTEISLSDKAKENDMDKATSLVVDLAGNGINKAGSRTGFNASCYMDNIAPSVKTVTVERKLKNKGNYTERGATFTTVGDENGFWVRFDEGMIFINGGKYTPITDVNVDKLSVQLNVREAGGSPVVAKGSKTDPADSSRFYFEYTVKADDAPLVYPGIGDLAVGVNRIYSSDPGFILADSRGNPYNEATELINRATGRIMPEQQLWLDVTAPSAATSIIPAAGKYTPLTYPGDSPEESLREFYFPIIVSDNAGPLASAEYISGINGVRGVVSWINEAGTGGAPPVKFQYYIGGVGKPDAGAYKTAYTGDEISFIQLEGGSGNIIHIKLVEGESYSLLDTELTVRPADNAGNTAAAVFKLNYLYDNIGPVITGGSHSTSYSNSDGAGRITAAVKIKDVEEKAYLVEYQWVDDTGSAGGVLLPADGAWAEVPPAAYDSGSTPQFKSFTLKSGALASGMNHHTALFIRTSNTDSTVTSASFEYEYDLTKPKYVLEFKTDPGELQAKHSVIFTEPEGTVAGSVYRPSAITLIKTIDGPGDEYWVKSALMPTAASGSLDIYDYHRDIFDIPSNYVMEDITNNYKYLEYFRDWHLCTVTGSVYSGGGLTITRKAGGDLASGSEGIKTANHRALSFLFNEYYGYLDMTLIAVNGEELTLDASLPDTPSITIHDTSNFEKLEYRLKSAYSAGPVHDVAITPLADDGTAETDANPVIHVNKNYTLEGLLAGRPQIPGSLDGIALRIDIRNAEEPGYGISDINFESSYLTIQYRPSYTDMSGQREVYRVPLLPAASQVVHIPAGISYEPGMYDIYVNLDHKAFAATENANYLNIYVDNRAVDTFGVTKVQSSMDFGGTQESIESGFDIGPDKRTGELFLSASEDMSVTFEVRYSRMDAVYFDPGMVDSYTHAYIMVWNPGDPSKTSGWKELNYSGLSDETGEYAFTSGELISWAGEGGMLNYQVMTSYGVKKYTADESGNVTSSLVPYQTPVQTLLVRTSGEKPTLSMAFTPDPSTGNIATAVSGLASIHCAPEELKLLYARQGGVPAAFTPTGAPVISEGGTYLFAAYDKYHNYTVVAKTLDIDKTAPLLSVADSSAGNRFAFTAEITDENAGGLVISFDDGYNALLGFDTAGGEDVEFKVPEAEGESGGVWRATGTNNSGIYRTVTAAAAGKKTIEIEGVFKYDETAGPTVSRTITLYAADKAGNRSAPQSFAISAANTRPAYIAGTYNATDGFKTSFTAPVILQEPAESAPTPVFEPEKKHVPIYENGNYTIKYTDIFGADYEESISVSAYDSFYDVGIAISETGPTNRDVEVTLDASGNGNVTLGLPASTADMTVKPVTAGGAVKGAVITISANRDVSFDIVPVAGGHSTVTRTISINNIDRIAPAAKLAWVFSSDVTDSGQTKGEVTVSLVAGEAVRGINGKATRHVFTLDDQEAYTFEYTDIAGNPGPPVTASLGSLTPPVTIVEKTLQELDSIPPDYRMDVYKTLSGSLVKIAEYTGTEYGVAAPGDPFSNPAYISGAMRLDFAVYDVNQTRLLLFNGIKTEGELAGVGYGSAGETVAGVTPGGYSVYINGNASFTAVIIDARDNKTLVPVVITQIDNIPPTGVFQYVPAGLYSRRAYIILQDNKPGTVTMHTAAGVAWDGAYNWSIDTGAGPVTGTGAYYHEFTANGSFTFTFEDAAGNVGTATAVVSALDDTIPEVTGVIWSPCLMSDDVNGDGLPDAISSQPPAHAVNTDVKAHVTFSKNVRTVTAVLIDEDGNPLLDGSGNPLPGYIPDEYFAISSGAADAVVAFKRGARLRLAFTALNGTANVYVLEVADVIDRDPPVITVASDEPGSGFVKSVRLTFSSGEPVRHMGSGTRLSLNNDTGKYEYSLTLSQNGTYTCSFVDTAGNIADVTYTASRIDNEAPVITLSGIPETMAQINAWNSDPANAGNPKTHTSTKRPVDFQVTVNEPGTLTFGAETRSVAAGSPVTLQAASNGYYGISAEDAAGNTAYVSFLIDSIDTSPPSIIFERSAMKVKQGTLPAEFETTALNEAYVSDNYDADMTGKYSLAVSLTQAQLDAPGEYKITYRAADSAGNEITVDRTVVVYDKTQPVMLINGIKADDGGTLFLTTGVIEAALELPDAGSGTEPYKLYYGSGLKTAGQMKTAGTLLAVTGGKAAFTADGDGFYTLYIITQSKKTFITYIYVQKRGVSE